MKYRWNYNLLGLFTLLLLGLDTFAAAPVAVDDVRTISTNSSATLNVLANDYDQDGDTLTIISASSSENSTTQINSDGSILYVPNNGFSGIDTITYTIQEDTEEALTATATVTITVQEDSFNTLTGSGNTLKVAQALTGYCDDLRSKNNSETGNTLAELVARCDALDALAVSDPDAAMNALRQIAPEETVSMLRSAMGNSRSHTGAVSQRIQNIQTGGPAVAFNGMNVLNGGAAGDEGFVDSPLGVFISLQTEKSEREQTAFENGYDADGTTFTVGLDYRLNRHSIIGGAFGVNKVSLEYSGNDGDFNSTTNTGIVFGAWSFDKFLWEAQLGYSQMSFETQRNIHYYDGQVNVDVQSIGKTRGTQYLFSSQGQWEWRKNAFSLYPFLRVDALQSNLSAYQEKGAAGYSIGLDKQRASQVTASTGLQATYALKYDWGVLIPTFQFSALSEIESQRKDVTGYFVFDTRSDNTFILQNDGGDTDFYQFSLGTSTVLAHGFFGFFQYQQLFGYDNFSAWQLQAGLRMELK